MQTINSRGKALKVLQDIIAKQQEGMVKFRSMEKNITGNEDLTEDAKIRKLNELSAEKEALTRAAQSRLTELRQGVRQWARDQGGTLSYSPEGVPSALSRKEMDFLDSLKYLEPSAEDFKQLAEQIAQDRSSSPALRKALTTAAKDHGFRIEGLFRSPSEYESELSGILDAAQIVVSPDNGSPEQAAIRTAAQAEVDAAINAPLDVTSQITVAPIITDENLDQVDLTQPDDEQSPTLADEVQVSRAFGLPDQAEVAVRGAAAAQAQDILFQVRAEAERAEYE